jgi:hypothetical protein
MPSGRCRRLRADGVHAAEDDVIDRRRVDARAGQQRPDDVRAEIRRVRTGQPAATAADRRLDGIHQERLGHDGSPRLHWF